MYFYEAELIQIVTEVWKKGKLGESSKQRRFLNGLDLLSPV